MVEPEVIGLCIGAFILGALPTGYIIGRLHGVDLRSQGSGNIGATNARRVLGKRAGILTLLIDAGKGMLAASFDYLFPIVSAASASLAALYGVCAIAGHCYSPFLKFKGGKGVATSLGVFIVLAPAAVLASFAVFVAAYALTGFASVGSISAAAALPAAMHLSFWGEYPTGTIAGAWLAASLVLLNHRSNIRRLIRRQELAAKRSSAKPKENRS
ncbi:MAG: glycerol-3-phosphate 1-O-acyltransferase PlsY [Bdellovibrionales bacterium]|nr:glycerol-3-phosphate 1-O-acyltransferase PlsY [Bdellovibrionales bacterium]